MSDLSPSTTLSVASTVPRKRRRATRVRSGCLTCKTRRVKCDEAKPQCLRCTQYGYRCDGYAVPATITFEVFSDPTERRAFAFYKERTSSRLLNLVVGDFWDRLALQASYREEAVRRMLAAHALRDEAMACVVRDRERIEGLHHQALAQYRRAIARVRDEGRSVEVNCLLIAIVLFASFDSMNGEYMAATQHCTSIIRIGKAFMQSGSEVTQTVATIVNYMANMATTLENANLRPAVGRDPVSEKRSLQDLREADTALEEMKEDILDSASMCWADPKDETARHAATKCLEGLKQWFKAYEHCTVSEGWTCDCPVSYLQLAPSYLEAWYRFLLQELQTALQPDSASDGRYDEDFRNIVVPCQGFLNAVYDSAAGMATAEECLGFKTSCISLLTLAGLRCRQPQLRRYAIRVLRWWHDVTGDPKADVCADLAHCLMRLEEATVLPSTVKRLPDIVAAARLHLVQATCWRQTSPNEAFFDDQINPTHFKVAIIRRVPVGMEAQFGYECQTWNRKGKNIVLATETGTSKASFQQNSTLVSLYRQLL